MHRDFLRQIFRTTIASGLYLVWGVACNDVSSIKAPAPQAEPGPFAILTSSPLPDGTLNVPYNIALAASGGAPGYTWSLAANSPQLPAGLTLSTNGILSGTPTATGGPVNAVIQVEDSGPPGSRQTITKTLSITIDMTPTGLTIATSSLPDGSINQPYATALGGNGGTTPYTWGLKAGSPLLPNGLTLSPSTGAIVGIPTVTSNATHTFTLTDATSFTVEKSLPLTISAMPLSITTDSLPQGTANQTYNAQLAATGGTGAYTWSLAGGSPPLPNGLALNASSGRISGTPTVSSNQTLTFMVTDQTPPTPQTATKTLQLAIAAAPPPLSMNAFTLPTGTVNQAYSNIQITATGGTPPYTWSVSPALPNGLSLNSSSGVISGIPLSGANGVTTHTFSVTDSTSPIHQTTSSGPKTLTINTTVSPLTISTASLPNGTVGQTYFQGLAAAGGTLPYSWSLVGGALPAGLSLSATGTISGTPTMAQTVSPVFRVQDSGSPSQSTQKTLSITIITASAPLAITTSSLPDGTEEEPYTATLQGAGGTAPFTWSVNPGMPSGLSLNASTGVISGSAAKGTAKNYNLSFTLRDSSTQAASKTLMLKITKN